MNVEIDELQKVKILNSDDVYTVMRKIMEREEKIDLNFEHVWVVCLSSTNKILNIELVSLGAIDETTLKPMQVFRIAVLKGAANIIMIHNHPSGELKPSPADKDITDRMIQTGIILHIGMIDHLIVTMDGYYSFEKKGLMEYLRENSNWEPAYAKKDKFYAEVAKVQKLSIAKNLLKEGLSVDVIEKTTGLSRKEIEKLDES